MAQTDERYFATYTRLDTESEDRVCVVNADAVSVGLELAFAKETYVNERGKEQVRGLVINPIGEVISFVPASHARRFCDLLDEGWTVRCAASAVAFNESSRTFWIEAAIIAYEPEYEETLGTFTAGCFERMAAGERPDIRLSGKAVDAAIADPDHCKKVKATAYPKLKKGDAYYKRRRTATENVIVAGSRHKGPATALSVLFWVLLVAIIVGIVLKFVL